MDWHSFKASKPLSLTPLLTPPHACGCVHTGDEVPKARDALGWHVSVYWKDDKQFYHGQVAEYDASSGKHMVGGRVLAGRLAHAHTVAHSGQDERGGGGAAKHGKGSVLCDPMTCAAAQTGGLSCQLALCSWRRCQATTHLSPVLLPACLLPLYPSTLPSGAVPGW